MQDSGKDVRFVDTTLRDGHMSLWATRMTTSMMLPVAERLDEAGFEAIEIIASAFFKKCVRDLREDPWQRLDLMAQRIRKTPLRAIRGRYMTAFQITPMALEDLFTERLAAHGVRQSRNSDCSNTPSFWRERERASRRVGWESIINLTYSLSPKHTDAYYAERARAAVAIGSKRLCIKDPGALLTPERVRTLVPVVLAAAPGVPVEMHTHCTTGLGAMCYAEAIRLGIRSVNTAIPPLAESSSNPSLFDTVRNARAMGYRPTVDIEALKPVEAHFTAIAKRYGFPIGAPAAYDYAQYIHQVPGGMISNFRDHLAKVGAGDKLESVLQEVGRVRAELGYPIMVTPYSQFVGAQAAMNVIFGERYKVISDEIIEYALGYWGEEEASSIDPDIRDRILGTSRARELAKRRPSEPTLQELRRKYGGAGVDDDELLIRYLAGADEVAAMRAGKPPPDAAAAQHRLATLLGQLASWPQCTLVQLRKRDLKLTLTKGRAPCAVSW